MNETYSQDDFCQVLEDYKRTSDRLATVKDKGYYVTANGDHIHVKGKRLEQLVETVSNFWKSLEWMIKRVR